MRASASIVRPAVSAFLTFAAVGFATSYASADIVGFGTGSGYTLNGFDQDETGAITNANHPPTISSGVLTLTTPAANEARSAYFNTKQDISSFVVSFTYRNDPTVESEVGQADGFTFVVQNQGLSAVGGSSSGLGYDLFGAPQPPTGPAITAITPSAAEKFYIRYGADDNGGTLFSVNGSGEFGDATSNSPVAMPGGDPILITLTYDGLAHQLTETLTDTTDPLQTYTLTRSADIGSAVGTTAYVGFTGGTGGGFSTQTISNFTFTTTPEPASLGLIGLATAGLLARRRRV